MITKEKLYVYRVDIFTRRTCNGRCGRVVETFLSTENYEHVRLLKWLVKKGETELPTQIGEIKRIEKNDVCYYIELVEIKEC